MLSEHVSLEGAGLIETDAAVGALVGALPGMAPPVPVEVAAVLELARAEGAVVRPFARVHPDVAPQVGTVPAVVVAVRTLDPGLFLEENLRASQRGTDRHEVTNVSASTKSHPRFSRERQKHLMAWKTPVFRSVA